MGIQINGQTDTIKAIDGTMTLPGTVTYEDVSRVNVTGIVTAGQGLHVTSGSVGIGTTNPSKKLDIRTDTVEAGIVLNSSGRTLVMTTQEQPGVSQSAKIGTTSNHELRIITSDEERLRIGTTGVSIFTGSVNPTINLKNTDTSLDADQVVGTLEFEASDSSSNSAGIAGKIDVIAEDTSPEYSMRFFTRYRDGSSGSTDERLRITSGGIVLINDTTVSSNRGDAPLQVETGANGNALNLRARESDDIYSYLNFQNNAGSQTAAHIYLQRGASNNAGTLFFATATASANTPTDRVKITNDGSFVHHGNVFYATSPQTTATFPVFAVYTGGSSLSSLGTVKCRIHANGDVENATNRYDAISDIKLKENIVDAGSQWSDIKSLQVRNFNFKAETTYSTHTQIGLIAQEVESISPGLVSDIPDRDQDGNDLGTVTKSVSYSVLYMKAVKALQEAMERIESLEQRLTDAGL